MVRTSTVQHSDQRQTLGSGAGDGPADASIAYDGLVTMVLAIREDPGLSVWFEGLARLPNVERRNEVFRLRQALAARDPQAPADVAAWLTALADDRVFAAAFEAYRTGPST